MGISRVSSGSGLDQTDVNSDGQVLQLRARIEDWSNCPTTDPQTKKAIVDRLQTQLDGVVSQIHQSDSARHGDSRAIDILA